MEGCEGEDLRVSDYDPGIETDWEEAGRQIGEAAAGLSGKKKKKRDGDEGQSYRSRAAEDLMRE